LSTKTDNFGSLELPRVPQPKCDCLDSEKDQITLNIAAVQEFHRHFGVCIPLDRGEHDLPKLELAGI
jgi:hypothetical protein